MGRFAVRGGRARVRDIYTSGYAVRRCAGRKSEEGELGALLGGVSAEGPRTARRLWAKGPGRAPAAELRIVGPGLPVPFQDPAYQAGDELAKGLTILLGGRLEHL